MPLAAYFFFKDYKDKDPNEELPPELIEEYRNRGARFMFAINDLMTRIESLPSKPSESDIQFHFYEVAKQYYGDTNDLIRSFFKDCYLLIWGNDSGVRMGVFVSLLGTTEFCALVRGKLANPFGIERR